MTKVIIKEVDGELKAVATVEIGLGNVHDERKQKEGVLVMGMGIDGMADFFEKLVYEKAQSKDYDSYKENLDQYVSFKMMQMIGMEQSPLKIKMNGKVEGLDKEVEVEVVGENL